MLMKALRSLAVSCLAEGIVVLVAAAVVLFTAAGFLSAILFTFGSRPAMDPFHWADVAVEKDGTPRFVGYDFQRELAFVYELDRRLVARVPLRDWEGKIIPWGMLAYPKTYYTFFHFFNYNSRYRSDWRYYRGLGMSDLPIYYLPSERYIVKYDPETRLPDYYISPSGLSPQLPSARDRFQQLRILWGKQEEDFFLFFHGQVHRLVLKARRMKEIYRARAGTLRVKVLRESKEKKTKEGERIVTHRYFVWVLDGSDLLLMDIDGTVRARLQIPTQMVSRRTINVGLGDNDLMAVWNGRNFRRAEKDQSGQVLVFDKDGARIATHRWELSGQRGGPSVGEIIAVAVFWLLALGLYLWHARKHALPKKALIGWGVLVLILGPPGLAVYFGVREFPPRIPCAFCAKKFPSDRDACPWCHAAVQPPARTGIEIIEPLG